MALGIRPIIDFAFQKTFGSLENKICLISLLNAILTLRQPIVDVTIENPFNMKHFEDDKLSIVDVKAKDDGGAVYHIEIQLSPLIGLIQRMVYYGCELYSDQLREGDHYRKLRPVYSICLLNGILWQDSGRVHHRFQLSDQDSGRVLKETLEVHILELGRYNLTESDLVIASKLECWLFWLLHAHEYETDQLIALLPEAAFQKATQSLTKIKSKTEEKAMYDSREKAIRDYHWQIDAAREEAEAIGEARGEARGDITGRISILESILKLPETPTSTLRAMSLPELKAKLANLQQFMQDRQ